ncbi:MAG: CotH kinase family protein [Deltaproteobacteria bacterium]|nr:CotH kinase family protein [Deltaproteobacteria bacterium]
MDVYYSPDTVISLTLTMDSSEWQQLRTQQPQGGKCNNDFIGDRYSWFEADLLTIEVSDAGGNAVAEYQYPDIGIKKKSYCGSIDSEKPSLNVDLAKYDDGNEEKAEAEIGTTRLTWNNSAQDSTVLKQCFGYYLFRLAGLPASRCNFSSLSVYTPDTGTTEYVGIYVNVEPIKKKYLKHEANGFTAGDNGNLYEISTHDFDTGGLTYDEYKGYSDEYVRQDFAWATDEMDKNLLDGILSSVNVEEFIRYWAMEAIVQHRDGYSRNITNAYIYNDNDLTDATSLSQANINFSFLPWGLDKIMDSNSCWQIYCCARVAQGLFESSTYLQQVNQSIEALLAEFAAQQAQVDQYLGSLATSANATWTGEDICLGLNDGQIDRSASNLRAWFSAALTTAVSSIDGGANNSCWSDCSNGPAVPCNQQ